MPLIETGSLTETRQPAFDPGSRRRIGDLNGIGPRWLTALDFLDPPCYMTN
jgi:hypothetical protein